MCGVAKVKEKSAMERCKRNIMKTIREREEIKKIAECFRKDCTRLWRACDNIFVSNEEENTQGNVLSDKI